MHAGYATSAGDSREVLEANLSPACEQRTDGIRTLTDRMTTRMSARLGSARRRPPAAAITRGAQEPLQF